MALLLPPGMPSPEIHRLQQVLLDTLNSDNPALRLAIKQKEAYTFLMGQLPNLDTEYQFNTISQISKTLITKDLGAYILCVQNSN